jgi:hypothetical protein
MSGTPIYDELAAILLADHTGTAEKATPQQAEQAKPEPSPPTRTGGRRRKPEPEA